MKKFIGILVFLLILGGAAFFFGWAQFPLAPGVYGVIRSKTHGVDPSIVREGEFRWVWYKLIPTNVKIFSYDLNKISRSIRSQGSLLSGQAYASLAGLNADFSWEVETDFSFTLNPESLPGLLETEFVNSKEDLRTYERTLADNIESFILTRLYAYGEDGKLEKNLDNSENDLVIDIGNAFPQIENLSCHIKTVRFPDFALYRSVKSLYEDYLERQRISLKTGLEEMAEKRVLARLRMDELEDYGKLLSQYPILLQYLAMEKGRSSGN